MTHPLRSTGITPLQHYKETDSPLQLDSDEAAMTYERFIRCGSAKPVANYYGAVRPSPAHQYFRPRGWSRLCLVWGFRSQAEIYHLHLFLSFVPSLCSTGAIIPCMGLSESSRDLSSPPLSFFRPIPLFDRGDHPFVPTRTSLTPARAEAVKVGHRTNLTACPAVARPHLDSFEPDGTLGAIGMTIR